ncbi:MAG: sigma-70 family RNA polymerase sigma factor [Deltaproteobacteria bacterium]|nr:sigma-70 family RNA polymerase sigma factor [Deltaproteobacteria bacterium]
MIQKSETATEKKGADVRPLSKKEQKDLETRDQLIEQYLPYASFIAGRVIKTLSSSVDFEDVMCNARLGLLEAAKRFDPSLNVDFKTFAYYRIKGAIYDGLRKSGWIPRSLYAKIKFEQASNEYLQYMTEKVAAGGKPLPEEEVGEMYETINSLASIYVISLDASEDMDIEDKKAQDIEQSAEFQQVKRHMKEAIESLPEKERRLIKMYYFQNKTLKESGEKIGLSKSWTSRLHARALELLYRRINLKLRTDKKTPSAKGDSPKGDLPKSGLADEVLSRMAQGGKG